MCKVTQRVNQAPKRGSRELLNEGVGQKRNEGGSVRNFITLNLRDNYFSHKSIVQRHFWRKYFFHAGGTQISWKITEFPGGGGSQRKVPSVCGRVGGGVGVWLWIYFCNCTLQTSLKILQSLTLHKIFDVKKSLKKVMKCAVKHLCTNNVFIISFLYCESVMR